MRAAGRDNLAAPAALEDVGSKLHDLVVAERRPPELFDSEITTPAGGGDRGNRGALFRQPTYLPCFAMRNVHLVFQNISSLISKQFCDF